MKRLLPFLLLIAAQLPISLKAQLPKPVFTASYSKSAANAGDILEIIVRFNIAPGHHVYSEKTDCTDGGPNTADLAFAPDKSYQLVGKFYGVGDKMVRDDEIFNCSTGEFIGKGEFRQKIKVLESLKPIKITLNAQICKEDVCDQIKNLTIATPPLQVTGKAAAVETPEKEPESPAIDTTVTDTTQKTKTSHVGDTPGYRSGDKGVAALKTFNGKAGEEKSGGLWGLFILAFISGITALITPCVFPMIPMTVSFFIRNKKRSVALRDAAVFSFSIIALYTVVGAIVAAAFGANAANWLSTHWIPNIFFAVIFTIFAASFFGAFEIVLPGWIVNKADKQADKGGLMGPVFMAITIVLVSFSCTGPIVGTVLVEAVQGGAMRPVIAMFGFSLAFALPFGLLAIFPSWLNNLPKSGGWLNSVKVVLGFVELAFALKFLSIPDQTYHWHILDREVYLSLWIVIFGLMGMYLLGKIKFSHDSDIPHLGVFRLGLVIAVFSFVVYMIPGLWGAPLKALAGYMPPMGTQDFDISRQVREANGLKGNICDKPRYADKLHMPHGLAGYFDYDDALRCARELKKPLFIDFTGHGCVNCRKMEEKVWSDPMVLKALQEDYVLVSLYVDDKKIRLPESEFFNGKSTGQKITMLGDKNAEIEEIYFGKTTQPLYCLLDANENLLQPALGADYFKFNTEPFLKFLKDGKDEFNKRHKK
ncbi:MAG: thioredoxin family protein [Bacteroidetes bacterium]|nr:thioredoxin family protein [Bacteroidota bacterium]